MKKLLIAVVCVGGFLWFAKYSYEKVEASDAMELRQENAKLEERIESLQNENEILMTQIRNFKDKKENTEKKEESKKETK